MDRQLSLLRGLIKLWRCSVIIFRGRCRARCTRFTLPRRWTWRRWRRRWTITWGIEIRRRRIIKRRIWSGECSIITTGSIVVIARRLLLLSCRHLWNHIWTLRCRRLMECWIRIPPTTTRFFSLLWNKKPKFNFQHPRSQNQQLQQLRETTRPEEPKKTNSKICNLKDQFITLKI